MEDFIAALPIHDRAVVRARIDFLAELAIVCGNPCPKAWEAGSFELRVKASRIFYCFKPGGVIVWLHGFIKKGQKTPRREMEMAQKRMEEV